jgi:hypothetical protein
MTPTAMRVTAAFSVEDVENVTAALLLAGRGEERADRPGGAALTADDFAEVRLGHFELEDRRLLAIDRVHLHLVCAIDEGSGDELDERFHFVFFRIDFTVGES